MLKTLKVKNSMYVCVGDCLRAKCGAEVMMWRKKAKELDKMRLTGHSTLNCHRPTSRPRDRPPFLLTAGDCHGDLFTVNGIERDSLAAYDCALTISATLFSLYIW